MNEVWLRSQGHGARTSFPQFHPQGHHQQIVGGRGSWGHVGQRLAEGQAGACEQQPSPP